MNYGYSPGRLRQIKYLMNRDGPNCSLCDRPVRLTSDPQRPSSATIDHVIPLQHGGTWKLSNLKVAHKKCNSKKGNQILVETETCENCGNIKVKDLNTPCHKCEFLRRVS